jgi:hypothetical protein
MADVSQETADIVDASVVSCVELYACVEYHNSESPVCGASAWPGPCAPADPENICVLRPGVLVYGYPQMVPYPGVDGGFVIIGTIHPECQHP